MESQARDFGFLKQKDDLILGSFVQSNTDSIIKKERPAKILGFSF